MNKLNYTDIINEWRKCKDNPQYFINTYVQISNPFTGKIQFKTSPEQDMLLASCEELRRVIVKKQRQVGVSITMIAYALWRMTFHNDKRVMFVTFNQTAANELMRKFKFSYDNLPDWMKVSLIRDNQRECVFINGSAIQCASAKSLSGRGTTQDIIVFDETAFFDNAEDMFLASLAALVTGGTFVITSSVADKNGWFETTFERDDTSFARMYMCKTAVNDMTKIPYSPPYMPIDEGVREIWAILVDLGYDPVKIVEYTPKKKVVFVSKGKETTINLSWAFRPA